MSLREFLQSQGVPEPDIETAEEEGPEAVQLLAIDRLLVPGTRRYTQQEVVERTGVDLETARRVALSVAGIADLVAEDGELRFAAGEDAVAMLTVALGRAGVGFTALVPTTASLEELFLDLTEGEQPPLVQEVA